MKTTPYISVVVPVYNEEVVLPELHRRVSAVLDSVPGDKHEIVLVDDGSRDRSWEVLTELAAADPRVRAFRLSRNFGHQAALTAAFRQARGDVLVVMDADLQDSPEAIPRLLEEYHDGYDVVYAIRAKRKESALMRFCYDSFYRVMDFVADQKLPRSAGDFALLSRPVVDQINACPEQNRYLRGLRAWVGFRQRGIVIERAARHAGETKYGPKKLLQLASDGIFSFSKLPLRATLVLGSVIASCSTLGLLLMAVLFGLGVTKLSGLITLALAIFFLGGVQLTCLGFLGEYVGRIYDNVRERPHFVIGESTDESPTAVAKSNDEYLPLFSAQETAEGEFQSA